MAVPNPERELQRLEKCLEKDPPPVLVILGADRFFRSEAVELAFAAVPGDADLRRVDGSQDSDGSELDDLRGGGLFGGGNWLAVRRGGPWFKRHGPALLELLPRRASGCGLILELGKLDKRTKAAKALVAAAEIFEFRELYAEPYDRSRSPLEAELVSWIAQRGRSRGVPLTPEAAYLLLTTVGKDPAELVAELERIRSATGDRPQQQPLTPDDLQGKLHVSFASTPFELAEALLAGERPRAERSLEAMYARGVVGKDGTTTDAGGVFPFVTSWLFQSLGNCLEGRRLLDTGTDLRDLAGRVGVRAFADRYVSQVRKNPQERLRRGLLDLLDCQRRLRTTGEEPRWLLRRFVHRWFTGSPRP